MTTGTIILPGRLGQKQGEIPTAVQGSRETVALKLVRPDGAAFDLTGATLTGTFTDGGIETYEITGSLVPDPDQTGDKMGLFTWARSAADVGAPGDYRVQIHVTKGGVPYKSFLAMWSVAASQGVTAVAPPGMVGVPQAAADWLAGLPNVTGYMIQPKTLPADTILFIPEAHQCVMFGSFTIDGLLQVAGEFIVA